MKTEINEYYKKMAQKSDFVLNLKDYNLHVVYFHDKLSMSDSDETYFMNRIKDWQLFDKDYGHEPFFFAGYPGMIEGIVYYGLITK